MKHKYKGLLVLEKKGRVKNGCVKNNTTIIAFSIEKSFTQIPWQFFMLCLAFLIDNRGGQNHWRQDTSRNNDYSIQ